MIKDTDIAVIGMTCRLPGANSIEAFWENLCHGVESVETFSDEELLAAGVAPVLLNNPNYVKTGTQLSDMELFDAAFFGYTPREAEIMAPQFRLFLECAHEALEHAGVNPQAYPDSIGVYAGTGTNAYMLFNLYPNLDLTDQSSLYQVLVANSDDHMPSRVSYKLNLRGPSVTVQTACSTSLVAIHFACQSLLNGECDMALAGGVTILVPNKHGYLYQEGMAFSPDGHCRAFDAQARGSIFSSGVGVVVLKMLEQAVADGDTIHAVIKGSAINNDGSQKVSYTAPSVEGQAQVIREAQIVADVEPESITYVETHGTGTSLGDPIEMAALTKAFETDKRQYCAIGSVKTNIGHTDAAAGVTGLIKAVLTVKHGMIPPSLNFSVPNPQIDFANSPFYVNTTLAEWPSNGTPRRAGVSSLGIGGTNAHVILEEVPKFEDEERAESRPHQLLLLSAKTASALDAAISNLAKHLAEHPNVELADVAYTLQVGRQAFSHRCMLLCQSVDEAREILEARDGHKLSMGFHKKGQRPVAFMFPGGGTQHLNMARDLYHSEPIFREELDHCAELLMPHLREDLRELLYLDVEAKESEIEAASRRMRRTSLALPALFAVEYALAKLWIAWGIEPQMMIGHSLGEYVAACLAGVFSLADALALVALRGRLIDTLPEGAMLSVSLPEHEIYSFLPSSGQALGDDLDIAVINAPDLCVVSGPVEEIARLEQLLADKGVEHRRLGIVAPGHSKGVDPILPEFIRFAETITFHPPQIPLISNPTGTWITAEEATDPSYWARHLRHTVRFADGIGAVLQEPSLILLEVGPGRTLSTLTQMHSNRTAEHVVIRALRHPREKANDQEFLLNALGKVWLAGGVIDWQAFHEGQRRRRLPLPTYPFERQRYWIDANDRSNDPSAGSGHRFSRSGPQETTSLSSFDSRQKQADMADWYTLPLWKQVPPLRPSRSSKPTIPEVWLLFVDAEGFINPLSKRLRASYPAEHRHAVITVQAGPAFAQLSESSYVINPQEASDYEQLATTLSQQERRPTAILHAWNLTSPEQADDWAALSEFERTGHIQQLGFDSLLYLTQMLDKWGWTEDIRITVLSNNMHAVMGEDGLYPAKSLALGWVRTMPHEYPQLTCRSIDIAMPLGRGSERLLNHLFAEITSPDNLPVVAYRHNQRWIQHFEKVRVETRSNARSNDGHACPPRFSRSGPQRTTELGSKSGVVTTQQGVYLITGGLGGVGMALAEYLAEQVQARLILLGRSPFPARSEWEAWLATHPAENPVSRKLQAIQAMEEMGAQVLPLSADAANYEQMAAAIEQAEAQFGQIQGVIQATGVPGGGVMLRQTTESVAKQLAPKVQGALVLDALFNEHDLDFMVFCSSLDAFAGSFGEVDYVASNAFLDAFAHYRHHQKAQFTLSINWGLWVGLGMTLRVEAEHERLTGERLVGMSGREGAEAFGRILNETMMPQVLISAVDIQKDIEQALNPTKTQTKELDEHINVPSETQRTYSNPLSRSKHSRPQLSTPYEAPRNETEEALVTIYQNLLGIDGIGIHDDFFELGGHSLVGTQVISHAREALDVPFTLRQLFEEPTVAGLAAFARASDALRVAESWVESDTQDDYEELEEGLL